MSFIEKYKTGFALVLGNIMILIGLYLPAKQVIGLVDKPFADVWSWGNILFVGLGIIFMWAQIAELAKALVQGAKNMIGKKTE